MGYYVRRGQTAAKIIHLAEEHDIDLIVMGSHGLTGVDRLMLGSVAEKTVQKAFCPVLIVKSYGKSLMKVAPAVVDEQMF